jgi:hypothetical protein
MGSILHITSQLNPERTYLHPDAVFHLIERGEPVTLGEDGDQRWAVPHAITIVEKAENRDDDRWPLWPESQAGTRPPIRDSDRSPTGRVPMA